MSDFLNLEKESLFIGKYMNYLLHCMCKTCLVRLETNLTNFFISLYIFNVQLLLTN